VPADDISSFLNGDDRGPDYGPPFDASYHSECAECGDSIDEGDVIRGVGDGDFIHDGCLEDWLEAR
jgi:hypothetical protein